MLPTFPAPIPLNNSANWVRASVVERGVARRDAIAIGGHSYGAFMTANLLAHSDLFATGIARSGAYNRTLTPFGFQSERRSLFEARDVYIALSPTFFADQVTDPVLVIHGNADSNPGTLTIQSEVFFEAVRGSGGIARLVLLPVEDHGYRSVESIEHVLWEQLRWFEGALAGAPDADAVARATGLDGAEVALDVSAVKYTYEGTAGLSYRVNDRLRIGISGAAIYGDSRELRTFSGAIARPGQAPVLEANALRSELSFGDEDRAMRLLLQAD